MMRRWWWIDGRGTLLVCMRGQEELESSQARESLGEGIEEIELEEMVKELSKMKNGKSLGVCNIQVELLKAGGMSLVEWMQRVFNMVLKSGRAPRDW